MEPTQRELSIPPELRVQFPEEEEKEEEEPPAKTPEVEEGAASALQADKSDVHDDEGSNTTNYGSKRRTGYERLSAIVRYERRLCWCTILVFVAVIVAVIVLSVRFA